MRAVTDDLERLEADRSKTKLSNEDLEKGQTSHSGHSACCVDVSLETCHPKGPQLGALVLSFIVACAVILLNMPNIARATAEAVPRPWSVIYVISFWMMLLALLGSCCFVGWLAKGEAEGRKYWPAGGCCLLLVVLPGAVLSLVFILADTWDDLSLQGAGTAEAYTIAFLLLSSMAAILPAVVFCLIAVRGVQRRLAETSDSKIAIGLFAGLCLVLVSFLVAGIAICFTLQPLGVGLAWLACLTLLGILIFSTGSCLIACQTASVAPEELLAPEHQLGAARVSRSSGAPRASGARVARSSALSARSLERLKVKRPSRRKTV
eukprot:g23970.t1